ncbi:MAG TPA: VWA domain-containing protein [Vicinamibacterales bacterium]|nr:VWA domain-containing protein [Vicinamibacterales bacterium]
MRTSAILVAVLSAVAAGVPGRDAAGTGQRPVFTSSAHSVSVDVSVRRGAAPVPNLAAAAFRLFDNGVEQAIEAVSIESVPIDVTLFHDTSPSLSGKIDDLQNDIRRIVGLLRPTDRVRLVTFGINVDVTPWWAAREPVDLSQVRVGRISAVNDALIVAMMRRPEPDRRHLVVALTDAVDAGSAVSTATLEAVAARAEAVVHLVRMQQQAGARYTAGQWLPLMGDRGGPDRLGGVAERTGGRLYDASGSRDVIAAFRLAFDDFRQSYVLRYSPTGVPRAGWHDIRVEVPGVRGATVRARRGYFVEGEASGR